jgi:hypothetical protein
MSVTAWIVDQDLKRAHLNKIKQDCVDEEDFMAHVLGSLPSDYDEVVLNLERELKAKTLTMKGLKENLKAKYSLMKKEHNWSDEESALVSTQGGTQTKTTFRSKFKGTCHNCGKMGHKSQDCWEKEENKNRRPQNFGSGRGNGSHTSSGGRGGGRGSGGRFQGKCNKCNKFGHKAAECRANTGGSS